jgi:proteasome lid subunit RPN8/RPN11
MRRSASFREPPGHHVVITENLAGVLLSYLSEAEHERGGVLLGHRNQSVTRVSLAVFPPQLRRDRMACEFDVGCLSVIHNAKDLLNRELAERVGTIVGWVHSHPRIGLFLSPTDEDTLSAWRQLDPEAVAVVADPHLRGHTSERLAWWRNPGQGYLLDLDPLGDPNLTILQVATVAEAINSSAEPQGRWDIVTARAVMRIITSPGGAGPRPTGRDRSAGQPRAEDQQPTPDSGSGSGGGA